MLHIGKMIVDRPPYALSGRPESDPAVALIDDVNLRLQTLTASSPEIARLARQVTRLIADFRRAVILLYRETDRFDLAVTQSHLAKAAVLKAMSQADEQLSSRSDALGLQIQQAVSEASRWVLGLSVMIALLSFMAIVAIVRRNFNRPLMGLLEHIDAIRRGQAPPAVATGQRDEWRTIHAALRDMTNELAKSRELLLKVIDTVPMRVFWKDRELRYLGCNPAFARDAGKILPQELIGKDDYEMAWAAQADLYRADDLAVMTSGVPRLSYEEPQTTPDGLSICLRTSKVVLRNDGGDVVGVLGIYEDVTAQKEADAELDRYRRGLEELVEQRTSELLATEARAASILNSAADGIFGVDADDHITFINPAACAMFGYDAGQVIGRSAHDLFHHSHADGSPYPASECPATRAALAGRELRVDDETFWHADGHPVAVTVACSPLFENGQICGAVISVMDVSIQRAARQAQEKAMLAAEALAKTRSQFLANMSHEIRTPMNGVLGFASIGLNNFQNPEKSRNAFEKILASAKRMLGVVSDILDFSKIDAGKLVIEASDMSLGEMLDQVLALADNQARAKGLGLRREIDPGFPARCISDSQRLGQILLNLLTNAVKFTPSGEVILAARLEGKQLVFRITDTGIGMTPDELRYVFDPFQQADSSTTRRYGGTGLGLSITRHLVELMHGEIRVESSPGVGSMFEVRLPYVSAAPSATVAELSPEKLPEHSLVGITILIAEDEVINQQILELILGEAGARVVIVGDGRQAVDRIRQDGPTAYDIVLMDMQMPVLNGLAATREILELAPDLPVLGQTANAFAEDREDCLAAGMTSYIAKPIDPDALIRLILQTVGPIRKTAKTADRPRF
ncbi:ATP-binding protein [Dechloromonas sp. HYN0024]|uniref:ATP-binding protein n=1 Tax=Dechloromonas sp. HYN0024 TaxID=2231055 RepID=UPI000E452F17|nr:ATP-binding protein [Dechloromonas sp. HYN0024]AXS80228.1 response regulator [Dechloromonas sp. HYN0024]